MRDCYFTFQLTSNCPDSQLSYEWNLVGVVSMGPIALANYSQKNTFIYNFLKSIKASPSSSIKKDDTLIPDSFLPTYLTSTLERNLGIDRDTLRDNTKYTFAVVVKYPDTPSFEFVSFNVPPAPRKRIFTIIPATGMGMSTQFTLMFTLPSTTDVDAAKYQIFRRDCPSGKSGAVQITQVLETSSSYSAVLAPGLKSCNYQVEIILRAMEYDSFIEVSSIITVKIPEKSSTDLVTDVLNMLTANSNNTSPNNKISLLNQVVSCPVNEASPAGKKNVGTVMGFIGPA